MTFSLIYQCKAFSETTSTLQPSNSSISFRNPIKSNNERPSSKFISKSISLLKLSSPRATEPKILIRLIPNVFLNLISSPYISSNHFFVPLGSPLIHIIPIFNNRANNSPGSFKNSLWQTSHISRGTTYRPLTFLRST